MELSCRRSGLLLARGADIHALNVWGQNTALHLAAESGHEEVVSILLGSGADISRTRLSGRTPRMCASGSGHMAVVRLLLRAIEWRRLDERSQAGRTALWWAYLRGHVDIVQAPLTAGADHTIADNDGTTPQQSQAVIVISELLP
jgi:ankyrin repeat protein